MKRALSILLALAAGPAAALDFGNMLQNLDVNRMVEMGERIQSSTAVMPEGDEIALGRDLAARLLASAPPLPDPEVQLYVNRVGRWLSLHTERPNLPWHFAVAATDALGAFATPGGNVIVTAGLLRLMRDENELAGVLAHEIAHAVHRHHALAITKRAQAGLVRDVAGELVSRHAGANPLIARALLDTGMGLYASGLDQEDEFAADRAGMVIAARAGYDPLALTYLLSTLDAIDGADARAALLFATHPPTRERIEALARDAEALAAYPGTLRDTTRFAAIQARLLGPPAP